MKANLYVMGEYQGTIDVADTSIVGSLSRGNLAAALGRASAMTKELRELGCTVTITTGIGKAEEQKP